MNSNNKILLLNLFDSHPLLHVALALGLGIILGDSFYSLFSSWATVGLLLAFCLLFFLLILSRKMHLNIIKRRLFFVLYYIAIMSFGIVLLNVQRETLSTTWEEVPSTLKVVLTEAPKTTEKSYQVNAQIVAGYHQGRDVRLTLQRSDTVHRHLLPGDYLLVHTLLRTPQNAGNPGEFDYARWLYRQGITGVGYCPADQWKISSIFSEDLSLRIRALRFREQLRQNYESYFSGRDLAVLSAMTLGDKTLLSAEVRDEFSQGGVSHVLALSGLHLSILFVFFQVLVLNRLRKREFYVAVAGLGILAIWGYVVLVGAPLSLLRAATMFTILQLMNLLRRDSLTINNLAFAAILILLFSPMSIFDVGFQLSFLSVFSILVLMPLVPIPSFCQKRRWMRYVYDMLVVSFCAQVATLPLVAYYFSTIPTYSLLVNLLVVPLTYALLAFAVLFFALPPFQAFISVCIEGILLMMETVLSFFIHLPGACFHIYPNSVETLMVFVLIIALIAFYLYRRFRILYIAAACVTLLGTCSLYQHWQHISDRQLIIYNNRPEALIHVLYSQEHSFLIGNFTEKHEKFLEQLRRTHWQREGWNAPLRIDSNYHGKGIVYHPPLLLIEKMRVVRLNENVDEVFPEHPLSVNILLLGKGCYSSIDQIAQCYAPKLLVLDANLSERRRDLLKQQAHQLQWDVHDLSTSALKIPLP